MPTTAEIQENAAWLKDQGYSVALIYKPAKQVQWYRADGTALPNLLPCDPYHLRTFRKKGWTLRPPAVVPPATNGHVATVVEEPAPLYVKPEKPSTGKPRRHRRTRAEIARDRAKAQEARR